MVNADMTRRRPRAWGHFDNRRREFECARFALSPAAFVQAPSQLWTFPYFPEFDGQEPIQHITVRQITSLYDDEAFRQLRDIIVLELDVPQSAGMQN